MLDPDRSIPTTVILPELEVGAIETLEDHWVSLVAPGQKQRTLVIPCYTIYPDQRLRCSD